MKKTNKNSLCGNLENLDSDKISTQITQIEQIHTDFF